MNTLNNSMKSSNSVLSSNSPSSIDDELFELTWNEILYDGGLATWIPRSSFRWLTICVCIIGVLGNILAVYTLLRPRMRTLSTYTYLTALCMSNTVTLISAIIFEIEVFIEPNYLNCLTVSMAKAFASSTIALSTWITVGFTVDRYIMICFPFIGQHKCTRRNAIYVIIICISFSITYLIPQLFAQQCYPLIHYPYNEIISPENSTFLEQSGSSIRIYWVSGLSEMGKSTTYRLTLTLFCNCFLIRIIPFLLVFTLNFRLIKTLGHTKRRHRQINPNEEKRNDITHMLVIVISIYLVCIMPSILFVAFFAFHPHKYVEISMHYRVFQYIDDFTKFLTFFNSASQCYLYIFFGRRFRRELPTFLCCLCVNYFYMSIPQRYTNGDRDHFSLDIWNPNDVFDLVLQGEWSIDSRQSSLIGLQFSFHHKKRSSHSTPSPETLIRSEPQSNANQINFSLLKRFKTRVEHFFCL